MTDTDAAPAATPQTAPAVIESTAREVAMRPAPREVRVVDDVIPLLDTARFEHMQRVAVVMAKSSLIPDAIRSVKGDGDTLQLLPPEIITANCFLIVNQAVRWNMDPFAVAACCSVVHGRLMYEGKLVAAVLEANLGVRLHYEFGKWDQASLSVLVGEDCDAESLGVRVSGQREGDEEPVYVDGSVGAWKTDGKGSPWRPTSYRRQLRYRGAREWARAYAPGVMLGVVTDDDVDELAERQEMATRRRTKAAKADIKGQLTGPTEGAAGFSAAHVEREINGGAKAQTEETPHDPVTGEVKDDPAPTEAEAGGDDDVEVPAFLKRLAGAEETVAAAQEEAHADDEDPEAKARTEHLFSLFELGGQARDKGQDREPPPDLDDEEAESWGDGWDARNEELAPAQEEAKPEPEKKVTTDDARRQASEAADLSEWPAPKTLKEGDYTLGADPVNASGQKQFYDGETGEPKGWIGHKTAAAKGVPEFDTPPAGNVAKPKPPADFAYTLSTDEWANPGNIKPFYVGGTKKGMCGKSQGLPEFASHVEAARAEKGLDLKTGEAPASEGAAATQEEGQDGQVEAGGAEGPDPLISALGDEIRGLSSWLDVKPRLSALYKKDEWRSMTGAEKSDARRELAKAMAEMIERTNDPVKPEEDAPYFRFWVEAQTDYDLVLKTFTALVKSSSYKKIASEDRDLFNSGVEAILEGLKK